MPVVLRMGGEYYANTNLRINETTNLTSTVIYLYANNLITEWDYLVFIVQQTCQFSLYPASSLDTSSKRNALNTILMLNIPEV